MGMGKGMENTLFKHVMLLVRSDSNYLGVACTHENPKQLFYLIQSTESLPLLTGRSEQ